MFVIIRFYLLLINNNRAAGMQVTEKQAQDFKQSITLTDDEKIRIIDSILKDLNFPKVLQVSVTNQPIKKDNRITNYETHFEYNIPGSKFKHKSKNSNLVSKLEDLQKNRDQKEANLENINVQAQLSPEREIQQQEEDPTNLKIEDNFRYYKDNIICFKCNKVGHYKAVCPQSSACLYCFSVAHQAQNCPQKNVCFRCYGFGHIYVNCKSKQSFNKCQICEKHHDAGCNFLVTKIRDGIKRKQFYDNIYTDKNILCIRCFNYGHIDCLL